ncbi:WD40 repeat protein [Nonomuraea thailandensis]|uniref:WD40 repeat protein n=1 Tax=Nonomuraea thailandensis TaxID=1188745 RepID=A0A9X2GSL6_9ACTN|nr:WD40 repeat domain-containing protein [Nonomuraea thailandensis]MCP2360138.1 WD40 repeat protein [Nonomuraea thailandensis]
MSAGSWTRRDRALLAVLVVVLGAAAYGWKHEHDRASAFERAALAHTLALRGAELRDSDLAQALAFGTAAVAVHDDDRTRAGLLDSVLMNERTVLAEPVPEGGQDVAVSADGRFALAEDEDGVAVWDLRDRLGEEEFEPDRLALLRGHRREVSAVALAADGRTALTGDEDGVVLVWNLTRPERPVREATLTPGRKGGEIRALALSGDARLAVAADDDGRMKIWDLSDRSRPARLSDTRAGGVGVEELALSADGRTAAVVVGEHGGWTTLWDLADPARPARLPSPAFPRGSVADLAMSADGRSALIAEAERLETWEIGDRLSPGRIAAMDLPRVSELAVTSDGGMALAAGEDGAAALLDLSQPSRPARTASLRGDMEYVEAVALSGDGQVALMASRYRGVFLWNLTHLDDLVADPLATYCDLPGGDRGLTWAAWKEATGGVDWARFGGYGSHSVSPCSLG